MDRSALDRPEPIVHPEIVFIGGPKHGDKIPLADWAALRKSYLAQTGHRPNLKYSKYELEEYGYRDSDTGQDTFWYFFLYKGPG